MSLPLAGSAVDHEAAAPVRVPLPGSQCGVGSGRTIAGPHTTMSFRLAIGHGLWQSSLQKEGDPMSSSMVNFIAIIVRRSGAMSLKPC